MDRHDGPQSRHRPAAPRVEAARRSSGWRSIEPAEEDDDVSTIPDERLALIFTCCHPALATEAQVALTLADARRLVDTGDRPRVPHGGADDGAAARARQAEDPRRRDPVPRPARRRAARTPDRRARDRLPDLQRGLLGRTRRPRPRGDPPRADARPADARRAGGARPARADAAPRLAARGARRTATVLLEDQDRSLWNAAQIAEGRALLRPESPGPYQLQAAIAACHTGERATGRGSSSSTTSCFASSRRRSSS